MSWRVGSPTSSSLESVATSASLSLAWSSGSFSASRTTSGVSSNFSRIFSVVLDQQNPHQASSGERAGSSALAGTPSW